VRVLVRGTWPRPDGSSRGSLCRNISITGAPNYIRCRNAIFGVGTDCVGGGNSIAYPQRGHPVAYRLDRAAYLRAEDERELVRIGTRPEVGVDEIHADRLGFDQHLAQPRRRLRLFHILQYVGAARFGDFDGIHLTIRTRRPPLSIWLGTTTRSRRYLLEQQRIGCLPVQLPAVDVVTRHIDGAVAAHESGGRTPVTT